MHISIYIYLLIIISLIVMVQSWLFANGGGSIQQRSPKESAAVAEEIRWIQAEATVAITTKHAIPIGEVPGIVSVITSRQIKEMGLRTLVDVLKIVPGFDVSMDETGEREIAVRGVLDDASQKLKVLIDGHSVNDPWRGGAMWNFDDLVMENVKQVEIIRGPGSALYGQNAFLAVINVITKGVDDIDGLQITASGGSFDTQNYNILFGRGYGDLKVSGFFDFLDTNGFSEEIEQDILFPESFSMSPGRSQNRKDKTDLNLKLSYHNLEIKSKYMKKRREGYIGIEHALNEETNIKDTYLFAELIYNVSLGKKLDMKPRVYYDQYNWDPFFGSSCNRVGKFKLKGSITYC